MSIFRQSPFQGLLFLLAITIGVLGNAGLQHGGAPPAYSSGDEPTILLDSVVVGARLETPLFEQPVMPQGVHLGYGLIRPHPVDGEFAKVIFDQQAIAPSTEAQVFDAYTDQDPQVAALVHDLNKPLPDTFPFPNPFFGVVFWFEPPSGGTHSTEAFGNPDIVFHIPPGAHITSFKMTVAPFTIEKRIVDLLHGGTPHQSGQAISIQPLVTIQPYSVWRIITDGPVATIDAYGPPPRGDATCNATIDSLDALLVMQHSAGLLDSVPCAKAADVNRDGSIDSLDAQLILQFTAGLISEL